MAKRENNPNWKGGRSISSHGYVLIRVGSEHHLADIRGYAYEHRLVAEELLGRKLQPGEMVHHINGDKADNRPDNITVVGSVFEHLAQHRTEDRGLRNPNEPNPVIECACGCGKTLDKYDSSNRPRKYLSGHNPRPVDMQEELLNILGSGPKRRARLAQLCNTSARLISMRLYTLKKKGLVKQISHGTWALKNYPEQPKENPIVECACGCGGTFRKFDKWGRPRLFIYGHQLHQVKRGT